MTTKRYRIFGLISISLCLITTSCTVMGVAETISMRGTITLDSAVAQLGYNVESLQIYSRNGEFLHSVALTAENNYYVWKTKIEALEGKRVTFWVQFFDKATDDIYFGEGQNDIIASDSAYDWTVSQLYVPIFSAADLSNIGIDSHYLPSKRYMLVSDINLAGNWVPLCSETNPFRGVFDGNFRTIHGLKFAGDTGQDIGLFGASKSATFRNLNIIVNNSRLELAPSHTQNIGFLVGNAQSTEISKVMVETDNTGTPGAINIYKSGGSDMNVGALVGCLSGYSTVSQSAAMIPLNISLDIAGREVRLYSGGLIGKINGTLSSSGVLNPGDITVRRCFSQGELAVSLLNIPTTERKFIYAGGLIGGAPRDATKLSITESYSAGNVSVDNAWSGNVGGLIGGGVTYPFTSSSALLAASTLTITRSVTLAYQINTSFSKVDNTTQPQYAVDYVAGQGMMASSSDVYYAAPLTFGGMSRTAASWTGSEVSGNGKSQARSAINVEWFGNQLPYGGLAWDFNSTWLWDAASGLPVFQW